MKLYRFIIAFIILFTLQFTFADNSNRQITYGSARISSHPDSLYFHFASGTVSGNPTGMDVMITGNEGTNFGNEGGFWGTVPFDNPSDLYYYAIDGSLDQISAIPAIDTPGVTWTTVSWDWNGGNGGQPLTVGNVWVVYTRTTHSYAVLEITQVNPWSNNGFSFNYMYQTDGSNDFNDGHDPCAGVVCDDGFVCDNGECIDDGSNNGLIYGSATMSAHPDSIYFNFGTGTNGSDTTGMDVMISGNEGTNFGSESAYFYDGVNWVFYSAFNNPSQIYYLSPDSSIATITSVPSVDETWPIISWSWPNGNGGQPLAVGNIWAVYCRTTQSYAVLEVTSVSNSWDYPRFSFNYYFQPDGSTSFDGSGGSDISGCTDPIALNYNPDATIDDGSCYYFVDCNGDPDGGAWIDNCNECVGGNTGMEPDWAVDDCGICFGENADMDCAGICFGNAYVDACGDCDDNPDNDCVPSFQTGSGTINSHPDSIYYSFHLGENGSSIDNMDIQITGNEGANFGSEFYFAPNFPDPSQILLFEQNGSLSHISTVPSIDNPDYTWTTVSWDWQGGTAGMPVEIGQIWVVHTRTTQNYAVMEITNVYSNWNNPAIWFDYIYQPNGSTSFGEGGDISGCTDPEAINYNPDATIDDGSCEYYNLDCNGDLAGQAYIDECGECVGGNTGIDPLWAMDDCGICFGQNQDMDCAGICFGDANIDYCGACDDDPLNDCIPPFESGTGILNLNPDSIYFNFSLGINSAYPSNMDIHFTINNGPNFGSDPYDGMDFQDPSLLLRLDSVTDLDHVTSVPTYDDPAYSWITVTSDLYGGMPFHSVENGEIWVVYTRTTHCYAVMELQHVGGLGNWPILYFDYIYQPDCTPDFDGDPLFPGCTDPLAINFDPDATFDDGSCLYDGTDCNGDQNGGAFIDECGDCVGGNTGLLPGYGMDDCGVCYGGNSDLDCEGQCFGNAYMDDCGTCDSDPANDCVATEDCDGVIGSGAYLDECGICVGGTTGLEPNEFCSAQIISIWDVPADQGGRVYVEFHRAASDMDSGRTTEGYTIERLDPINGEFIWVAVASGYAYYQDIYTYEVSTLQDSSDTSYGITDFRIISGMDEGTWISDPASGYSVDNIAPGAPAQLLASFASEGIELTWSSSSEMDFQYYTMYRNDEAIGYVTDNAFADITFEYGVELEYLVTATDSNGNESEPSNIQTLFGGASGDINGDAVLNVSDLVLLVDMILNGGYDEYQTWAGDLNDDGIINVLDVVFIVNVILSGELNRGHSLNEAQVSFGSGELTISGDGNLAGIQLQLTGNYQLNPEDLPLGWQIHHQAGLLLLFDAMGSALINELTIFYTGDLMVETALAADGHGNGIMADIEIIPEQFRFNPAYPNPFNPVTNFEYELPENSHVEIIVYDMLGTKISELQNGNQSAGSYQMTWNAGSSPSGVYFIKIEAGNEISFQKVLLVK